MTAEQIDKKKVDLAAETLARLLIQQITYKKNNQIDKNIEMKKYGKSN